jgi:hypothetical protein
MIDFRPATTGTPMTTQRITIIITDPSATSLPEGRTSASRVWIAGGKVRQGEIPAHLDVVREYAETLRSAAYADLDAQADSLLAAVARVQSGGIMQPIRALDLTLVGEGSDLRSWEVEFPRTKSQPLKQLLSTIADRLALGGTGHPVVGVHCGPTVPGDGPSGLQAAPRGPKINAFGDTCC